MSRGFHSYKQLSFPTDLSDSNQVSAQSQNPLQFRFGQQTVEQQQPQQYYAEQFPQFSTPTDFIGNQPHQFDTQYVISPEYLQERPNTMRQRKLKSNLLHRPLNFQNAQTGHLNETMSGVSVVDQTFDDVSMLNTSMVSQRSASLSLKNPLQRQPRFSGRSHQSGSSFDQSKPVDPLRSVFPNHNHGSQGNPLLNTSGLSRGASREVSVDRLRSAGPKVGLGGFLVEQQVHQPVQQHIQQAPQFTTYEHKYQDPETISVSNEPLGYPKFVVKDPPATKVSRIVDPAPAQISNDNLAIAGGYILRKPAEPAQQILSISSVLPSNLQKKPEQHVRGEHSLQHLGNSLAGSSSGASTVQMMATQPAPVSVSHQSAAFDVRRRDVMFTGQQSTFDKEYSVHSRDHSVSNSVDTRTVRSKGWAPKVFSQATKEPSFSGSVALDLEKHSFQQATKPFQSRLYDSSMDEDLNSTVSKNRQLKFKKAQILSEDNLSEQSDTERRSPVPRSQKRTDMSNILNSSINESGLNRSILVDSENKSNLILLFQIVSVYLGNLSLTFRRVLLLLGSQVDKQTLRQQAGQASAEELHNSMISASPPESLTWQDYQNIVSCTFVTGLLLFFSIYIFR